MSKALAWLWLINKSKRIFWLLTLCLITTSNLVGFHKKKYIVMHSREEGMFGVWMDVLAMVHCHEKGFYHGMEVNFEKGGYYYDEAHGDNWWTYYCEPIKVGDKNNVHHVMGDPPGHPGWIERILTRHQAKAYIEKYIRIKPYIMDKVTQFQINNFIGYYVITLHYRGTDKFYHDSREVPYSDVARQVDKVIKERVGDQYKIFIATDEQRFLDYMVQRYGDSVCFNDAMRSNNNQPVHINNTNPYQQGLEAVMDVLLLARGHYLIRTTSNLSRWSTFFNPDIPVFELNQLDPH